ncbi:uncharacterized protein BT62DRAFT_955421 [Guyanagaster necrorhizus]|uniref:Uncharacterized protein n=1 Tax=Guyanagaster necrorhizus TaxID=856835 RepID=A0A9P8ANJ6_9AGAR|nr:uncharacterized protein BT62DRAFT_955421 [Guyanagaster necrorhizus MCA 3950]KAG7441816.1 hypothetical protein BT62DRAFT_955421 [Guyanagaster necrorhizus MCA 3950]
MLLSFIFHLVALASASVLHRRQQVNQNPTVGGDPDHGWKAFPQVNDATAYPSWVVNDGAQLPVYQTSGLNNSEVTRAVIVLPARPRDCWYYWNVVNNALYNATFHDSSIRREDISIMAPCFFTQADMDAGATGDDVLLWGMTTWIDGKANILPSSVINFSSFDVLDALVSYYMDTQAFPNLNTVVVGGHSAGGQMTQRYATLRKSTENDDRLHFWIANPGSLCWLTAERPMPNSSCIDPDKYKYGLESNFPAYATSDTNRLGRDGIVSRYIGRNLHYAWGTADNGPGDISCEALAQGRTHLERGRNFVAMLEKLTGGIPALSTVDWIEGVSHSNEGMMNSEEGIDKLFRYASNATARNVNVSSAAGSRSSSSPYVTPSQTGDVMKTKSLSFIFILVLPLVFHVII